MIGFIAKFRAINAKGAMMAYDRYSLYQLHKYGKKRGVIKNGSTSGSVLNIKNATNLLKNITIVMPINRMKNTK